MNLNFDYINARKLLLPAFKSIHLVLVGCGGTGSWLAPHVVRAAMLLRDKLNLPPSVLFFDPDVVEMKNTFRQNFCQAEIGRNKAIALADRYGPTWGIDIAAYAEAFSLTSYRRENHRFNSDLVLLIGCVDNTAARRELLGVSCELARRRPTWWLDCGNHRAAGQVVLGSGLPRPGPKDIFPFDGLCAWLPSPADLHPDLVADEPARDVQPQDAAVCLSCADLAMIDEQSLGVNVRIAAEAADFINRMLLFKDLRRYATYIDLPSGSANSRYITPENIERDYANYQQHYA